MFEGEQIMSTPEKNNELDNIAANITAISEVSSHFQDNIRQLTPIEDIKSLKYHDKTYLDSVISKASRGDTFFPETIDRNYYFNNNSNTPIFNKSPSPSKSNNLVSTSLIDFKSKINSSVKPVQFDFTNNQTKTIFNLSPELISHQPGLKSSTKNDGSINPVKGAFNMFDKNTSFASGTSSIGSRKRSKKRLRSANVSDFSFDMSNNNSSKILYNKDTKVFDNSFTQSNLSQSQITPFMRKQKDAQIQQQIPISKYEYFHRLISDPQCISNLTLIIQILLNTLMVLVFFGFSLVAFFAIKRDVDHKIQSYVNDSIHKINSCTREYLRNNCAPDIRAPALEEKCNDWDTCMSQDPQSVVTSMAYFEVMADCMNAFFHHVSIKSLLGIGCLMLFCIIVPNILFSKFRSTTINQNYYNNGSKENELSNIQTLSPLKLTNDSQKNLKNNQMLTPNSGIKNNKSNGDTYVAANTSGVRFNPNVSYSMYDYEDDSNEKENVSVEEVDDSNEGINDIVDEDDENLLANQRILLDD